MSYIPIIARVESLPPLPESVVKIENLFTQEDPNIDDIVRIIERDPSLTVDVLAKVNAPFYGLSKTITSIMQAVTLFGSSQIRSIVLSSSMQRSFDVDLSPYGISTAEFSEICSLQSELAFQWCMQIDTNLARQLTPIAFLMETGKIFIAKDVIEKEKADDFLEDISSYENIDDVENIYTMMSSAQISSMIFKHLNLSDDFWICMQYLNREHTAPEAVEQMVQVLEIVRTIVNIQEQFSDESTLKALELVKNYNYDSEAFLRVVKRVKNKFVN